MEKCSWTGCRPTRRGGIVLATGMVLCCHAQEATGRSPETLAPSVAVSAPASPQDSQVIPAEVPQVDPLEVWIEALATAESGNRQWLVHRDRDGQLYYGCLQFQEKTFLTFVRKFHLLKKGTRAEAMDRIYDCALQKRLASLMLRDDRENWKHWRNTVENRIGLPPPVTTGTAEAQEPESTRKP
jgi:hypothetical protein